MQVESTKKSPGIFSGSRSAGLAMPNEVSTTCVSGWAIRLTRGCVLEYDEPASVGVQVDTQITSYGSRTSCPASVQCTLGQGELLAALPTQVWGVKRGRDR